MKIISLISLVLFCGSVWSSEYCKMQAQMAVDVRNKYKNLAEIEEELILKNANLRLLTGQDLIQAHYDIDKLRIIGKIVFLHSSGATGSNLFKVNYDHCVTEEKANNARNEFIAKQAEKDARLELADLERNKLVRERILSIKEVQMQRIKDIALGMASPPQRSSPPSARYAGKIIESIQSNIKFLDSSARNSWVVVLIKISSNGLILSRRVVGSSGNNSWNEEVLRAVDKMASVPYDTNGLIPEVLVQEGLEIKVTF